MGFSLVSLCIRFVLTAEEPFLLDIHFVNRDDSYGFTHGNLYAHILITPGLHLASTQANPITILGYVLLSPDRIQGSRLSNQ